ncbi:MAG: SRPBCC domain-containing protein [Chlorobiaceae bacterium]|nr:SRPBCC domain-containing protein [Chlorobiaceae bacterium]
MDRTVRTEIVIDAPPERVWQVLCGFDRYGAWNPFIRRIVGTPGLHHVLHVTVRLSRLPATGFKAKTERFMPGETLGWHAVFLRGLFEAHHWFELHPLDSGRRTRFVHGETFAGLFAAPILGMLLPLFRQGYDAMNRALKNRAERK